MTLLHTAAYIGHVLTYIVASVSGLPVSLDAVLQPPHIESPAATGELPSLPLQCRLDYGDGSSGVPCKLYLPLTEETQSIELKVELPYSGMCDEACGDPMLNLSDLVATYPDGSQISLQVEGLDGYGTLPIESMSLSAPYVILGPNVLTAASISAQNGLAEGPYSGTVSVRITEGDTVSEYDLPTTVWVGEPEFKIYLPHILGTITNDDGEELLVILPPGLGI